MAQNSYELNHEIEENVYNFQLITDSVLVKYFPDDNDTTLGGIVSPKGSWEGAAARNVVRLSEVIKVPKQLYFNPKNKGGSMHWRTTIEIKPGDFVVTDHMESNNAYMFKWKDEHFRLVDYKSIDAVKRGSDIIPINGNVLIKPLKKKEKALDYEKEVDEENLFEVHHVGKRNEEYIYMGNKNGPRYDFKYPIKPGDKVILFKEQLKYLRHLEQPEYARLDNGNVYFVCKRWMIAYILPK